MIQLRVIPMSVVRGPLAMRFTRITCGAHCTCARVHLSYASQQLLNALLLNLVCCYASINTAFYADHWWGISA